MCSFGESEMANVNKTYTQMPSYLQELVRSDEYIYLIYNTKSSQPDNLNEEEPIEQEDTICNTSELDLTGCPLETDLKGPDLSISIILTETIDNWSLEENKHFPISLEQATFLINTHNNVKRNRTSSGGDCKKAPIYVVCDGCDSDVTVLKGGLITNTEFSRMLVHAKGYYPLTHPSMQINAMKTEHLEDYSENTKIESEMRCIYDLYGNRIKNEQSNLNKFPYIGSAQIEVVWKNVTTEQFKRMSSLQMILQVITGHPHSPVFPLWEQVILLKNYVEIMQNTDFDDTEIVRIGAADNSLNQIFDNLHAALFELKSIKEIFRNNDQSTLDMNNIRDETFLDKLYNNLTLCENTKDLKRCFAKIFTEIAQNRLIRINILDDNSTGIVKTILDIHNGVAAVPNVTDKQALEFLIELGLEKLRQDYFYIFLHFNCLNQEQLDQFWTEYLPTKAKPETPVSKLTKSLSRKFSICPKTEFISQEESVQKLTLIGKMHIVTEFLFLIKEISELSTDCFNHISEHAIQKYLKDFPITDFGIIEDTPLFNLNVPLPLHGAESKMLERKSLASCWLEMNSLVDHGTSIRTIYLQTKYLIFPPKLFNKYDTVDETEEPCYYLTKFVMYSNDLPMLV